MQDIWWSLLVELCDPHIIELFMMSARKSGETRGEICLRRELTQLLAAGRQTQQNLESLVSPELSKLMSEDQWGKVLGEIAEVHHEQKRSLSLKQTHMGYYDVTFRAVFLSTKGRTLEPTAEETILQKKQFGLLGPSLSNTSYYSTIGSSIARRILDQLVSPVAFPMNVGVAHTTAKRLKLIRLQESPTWGTEFLQTVHPTSPTFSAMVEFLKRLNCDAAHKNSSSDRLAEGVQLEKQRNLCKQRQAAILEKMRAQQCKFSMEEDEVLAEEMTCCMCREGAAKGPLGYLSYVEPRPIFKSKQPFLIGWTTCGHVIHVSCGSALGGQQLRTREHRVFYDPTMLEFDCPVCRGLSNWILPTSIDPTSIKNLLQSHHKWIKKASTTLRKSLIVQALVTMKYAPHTVEEPPDAFFSTLIRTLIAYERSTDEQKEKEKKERPDNTDLQTRLVAALACQDVKDWSQADIMQVLVDILANDEISETDYLQARDFLLYTRSFQLLARLVPDLQDTMTQGSKRPPEKTALEWFQNLPDPPVPVDDFKAFLQQGCWAINAFANVLQCCMWDVAHVARTKLAFAIQEGGVKFDISELLPSYPCAPNKKLKPGSFRDSLDFTGAAPFPASVLTQLPGIEQQIFPTFAPLEEEYGVLLRKTYQCPCKTSNCGKVPVDPYLCLRCGSVCCIGLKCNAAIPDERKGGCRVHAGLCGNASIFLSIYGVHLIAVSTSGFCGFWEDIPYTNSNGEVTTFGNCLSLRADPHRLRELEKIYCTSIRREIFRHSKRTSRFIPQPFEL